MKNKIIALILCFAILTSLGTVSANAYTVSSVSTKSVVKSTSVSKISDLTAKAYLFLKYGNNSFYNNQWQTVKTLSKVNDNIYTLDYRYDYDIDDLLSRGTDSIADLLVYCSNHLANNKFGFKLDINKLGCSAFTCQTAEGEQIMGRNFDYKDSPCFVVWTSPEKGYKSVSMVDANMMLYGDILKPSVANRLNSLVVPYIPLDGINEKGLSVGVLQVKADGTNQDTGKTDILTTVAIRAMLDKAATVDEAVALLEQFDMHDMLSSCNYHYMISDATGKSVVVEYINNDMRVLDANVTTNFFLSADGVADTPEGQERFEIINNTLDRNGGKLDTVSAMKLLNTVHLDYQSQKYPWRVTTLWSAVYNNTKASLTMCARMDYDSLYYLNPKEPGKVYILKDADAGISDYVCPKN